MAETYCSSRWRRRLAGALFFLAGTGPCSAAGEAIRFEIPLMPALERYTDMLAQPGTLAVALENNGLSPSMSSRLQVRDAGKSVEIRNASLRYLSRKGSLFTYEAAVTLNLGVSESKLAFPVSIDLAQIAAGRGVVTLMPPLASLVPAELVERIQLKTEMIANASAQQRILGYLNGLSGALPQGAGADRLAGLVLIDAYNKGGGPAAGDRKDAGDAIPVSEQWMLLATCAIWFFAVPGALLYRRWRSSRTKPA